MNGVHTLPIAVIRLDFQPAENLIGEIVQYYVERLKRGESLPPVRVRFDGENYWLEDGFHRLEATHQIGQTQIQAEIIAGTLAEMEEDFKEFLKNLRANLKLAAPVRASFLLERKMEIIAPRRNRHSKNNDLLTALVKRLNTRLKAHGTRIRVRNGQGTLFRLSEMRGLPVVLRTGLNIHDLATELGVARPTDGQVEKI